MHPASFGRYVQRYRLAEACDDIGLVLRHVALAQGGTQKVKVLTGTGEFLGGIPASWVAGDPRVAPGSTDTSFCIPRISRECQHNDA